MMKIYYQGPNASFSESAAETFVEKHPLLAAAKLIECSTFLEVFCNIENDKSDNLLAYGVVPLENSIAGTVQEIYNYLHQYRPWIVGEGNLFINLVLAIAKEPLLSVDETLAKFRVENLTEVLSHPKALAQCEKFFASNPHLHRKSTSSTSYAALALLEQPSLKRAALVNLNAVKRYNLIKVVDDVQDEAINFTRFALITNTPSSTLADNERTTVKMFFIVELKDEPGALARLLTYIWELGGNLTKIESRPIPARLFNYVFYLDISGTQTVMDRLAQELILRKGDYYEDLAYLGSV
jgi:chorismate mutase/prephenate dehydratase